MRWRNTSCYLCLDGASLIWAGEIGIMAKTLIGILWRAFRAKALSVSALDRQFSWCSYTGWGGGGELDKVKGCWCFDVAARRQDIESNKAEFASTPALPACKESYQRICFPAPPPPPDISEVSGSNSFYSKISGADLMGRSVKTGIEAWLQISLE